MVLISFKKRRLLILEIFWLFSDDFGELKQLKWMLEIHSKHERRKISKQ